MSVVTLQIGQCGNQIGHQFFHDIFHESVNASLAHQQLFLSTYFHSSSDKLNTKPIANSLLIDMEPKVISKCLTQTSGWIYDPALKVYGQSGCGNNWAYGYNDAGPLREEEILSKLDKLLEKVDYLGGIIAIQSMAGGTGSGLGTYVSEQVKDLYGKKPLINVAVWPYSTGEIIVQNYNTVLSLSRFIHGLDGVVIVDNDEAMNICKMCYDIKNPTFYDLNAVISSSLKSVFLPCITEPLKETCAWRYDYNVLRNIYENLLLNPEFKLLQIKNAPQTSEHSKEYANDTWEGLIGRLHDMLLYDATEMTISKKKGAKPLKALGGTIYARGKDAFDLKCPKFPCSRLVEGLSIDCVKDKHQAQGVSRSVGAIWNSPFLVRKLKGILGKVYSMYKLNAYTHHYAKYGIMQESFRECFIELENVVRSYEAV